MASLAGIISQHGKIDTDSAAEVGKMLILMRHRGPDNSLVRSLTDARGALGVNEINLAPDRTYCSSLEETPYILFDGKLFNERPEGQNDISLFREYYEKYERDCFKYLDGSFSCAIIEKDDEVILARDAVGARPLVQRPKGTSTGSPRTPLGWEEQRPLCMMIRAVIWWSRPLNILLR